MKASAASYRYSHNATLKYEHGLYVQTLYCRYVLGDMVYELYHYKINTLSPSGYYMYRQFNIHNSTFCPHSCIYVFCVDLRTNSDYFPIQH